MHTDSEMTSIFDWDSMHYMTAVSLEMSDEPQVFLLWNSIVKYFQIQINKSLTVLTVDSFKSTPSYQHNSALRMIDEYISISIIILIL